MKKITRRNAVNLFAQLGAMALGHLDDETLTATMDNFNTFRKVQEDFEALKKELFKRIYGDVEKMDEDEKKRLQDFFDILNKMQNNTSVEKLTELDTLAKETYPELYEMRKKEINVILSLLAKEIEVEIVEVDADDFIKGIVKGKKDAPVHKIRAVFAPMFKEEKTDDKKADFSELDELLKQQV